MSFLQLEHRRVERGLRRARRDGDLERQRELAGRPAGASGASSTW